MPILVYIFSWPKQKMFGEKDFGTSAMCVLIALILIQMYICTTVQRTMNSEYISMFRVNQWHTCDIQHKTQEKQRKRCYSMSVECWLLRYAKLNSTKTWFSTIDSRFIDVRQQVLYMFYPVVNPLSCITNPFYTSVIPIKMYHVRSRTHYSVEWFVYKFLI